MGVSNATIDIDSGVAPLRALPPASEVGQRPGWILSLVTGRNPMIPAHRPIWRVRVAASPPQGYLVRRRIGPSAIALVTAPQPLAVRRPGW